MPGLLAKELARVALSRIVYEAGQPFRVSAPVVQTVLELLASRPGAIAGQETDQLVFDDALREWLPAGLYNRIHKLPVVSLAPMALAWAVEGQAARKDEEDEEAPAKTIEEVLDDLAGLNYDEIVANYAKAFNVDPYYVLTVVPYSVMMAFRAQVIRVKYAALYDDLMVASLAGAASGAEKDKRVDQLRKLAGILTEEERVAQLPREEQLEFSRKQVALFEKMMGYKESGEAEA